MTVVLENELIINFDQTELKYVPVSDWTMEKEGSKKVPITGLRDKCHLYPTEAIHPRNKVCCIAVITV